MSVEARAHLDAALAAGERELEVRAYLLAHPELPAEEQTRLRALCRFLDSENERAMAKWWQSVVYRYEQAEPQETVQGGEAVSRRVHTPESRVRVPPLPARRDIDDRDDWSASEPLL